MIAKSTLAVVTILLSTLGARADDTSFWKNVGHWQIRVDATVNYGCFMIGFYDQGDVFRIGFDQTNGNGYIVIANESWKSIEVGKKYDLLFTFDQHSSWNASATGVNMNGTIALYVIVDKGRFILDLAQRQMMSISYNGRVITSLPLPGTYQAVQALIDCQSGVENARNRPQQPSDPFSPQRNAPDPFR